MRCSVCGKNCGHYCSNCSWDENFARGYCSDECRKSQGLESYTDDELLEYIRAYRARTEPVLRAFELLVNFPSQRIDSEPGHEDTWTVPKYACDDAARALANCKALQGGKEPSEEKSE